MPKILIADDSIAVRKVAERLLTEAGMGVTLAANGTEALAMLGKERPDLIVSDVIMPDKSGYEVCAYIRAQAGLADLPVLLISGIVNDEVSRQAESCQADGVLKKPFQGTSLKDRVLELLGKRSVQADPTPTLEPDVKSIERPAEVDKVIQLKSEAPRGTIQIPVEPPVEPVIEVPLPAAPMVQGVPQDVHDRQTQLLTEREARLAALEQELANERGRRQEHQDQLDELRQGRDEAAQQAADLTSRCEALTHTITEERAQQAALTERVEELSRQAHRADELASTLAETHQQLEQLKQQATTHEQQAHRADELASTLAETHQQLEQLKQQAATHEQQALRIAELEAHLGAERGAASQLVQQITTLEYVEHRAQELDRALAKEREQVELLTARATTAETLAATIPALEMTAVQERERAMEFEKALAAERAEVTAAQAQIAQLEMSVQRAQDLERALSGEQGRAAELLQRATTAEQAAEQATRRFEDMARKLGEIAGLASQLGSNKHS